jgi:hypothetical protein
VTFIAFELLRNDADLATFFGCEEKDIARLTAAGDQSGLYRRMEIPKKHRRHKGGIRTVYKAEETLASIQRDLNEALCDKVSFPACVQAFVRGRSIISNARVHVGARKLLHADIQSFFESISAARVEAAFQTVGCRADVAQTLARLATLNGRLPTGSSASPAIANLVCRDLDIDLEQLAGATGCRYTRYADDITVSGEQVPELARVEALLGKHGFALRPGSGRVQTRGKAQYVTGLSVSAPSAPHVPRRLKRRLRLILHYIERFGFEGHAERVHQNVSPLRVLDRLDGTINFVRSVEGSRADRIRDRWRRLRKTDPESPQGS